MNKIFNNSARRQSKVKRDTLITKDNGKSDRKIISNPRDNTINRCENSIRNWRIFY